MKSVSMKRFLAGLLVAGSIIVAVGALVVWGSETVGQDGPDQPEGLPPYFDQLPPEKQAVELQMLEERKAAEAAPSATKNPDPSPVLSCPSTPNVSHVSVGEFQAGPVIPGAKDITTAGYAISSGGVPYYLWAGAADEDAGRGVIVTVEQDLDACATAAGITPRKAMSRFTVDGKTGAVTMTAIDGDFIVFETESGTKGRFNYSTGQFVP